MTQKSDNPPGDNRIHLDEIAKFLFSRSEQLVISFVNAGFGMNYDPGTISLRLTGNEFIQNFDSTRADIVIIASEKEIKRDIFHIEVQVKDDSEMSIRMFDYGYNIGLSHQNGTDADGRRILKFPYQLVVFLDERPGIRDTIEVLLVFPDGQEMLYQVPILKIRDYTINDLINRGLYLLLPFKIFEVRKRFEAARRAKTNKEERKTSATDELLNATDSLMHEVDRLYREGKLNSTGKDAIVSAAGEIYYHMSAKYSLTDEINKKVDTMVKSIMEEVKKEGRQEGRQEGLSEGVKKGRLEGYKEIAIRLLERGFDIDSISTITGLSKQDIESLC